MGDDFSIGHIKHPGMLVLRFGVRDAPELQRTWRNVRRTTLAQLDDCSIILVLQLVAE